jgi:predicted DNA-binding protein (UPF0278 family)
MDDDSSSDSDTNSEFNIIDNAIIDNAIIDNTIIDNAIISMDNMYPEILNYKINFTVKQLMQVCEYYGISKNMKSAKANKDEIINNIVLFENNPDNYSIVIKRKLMWYYIEELKSDKFMKKFVLLWQ